MLVGLGAQKGPHLSERNDPMARRRPDLTGKSTIGPAVTTYENLYPPPPLHASGWKRLGSKHFKCCGTEIWKKNAPRARIDLSLSKNNSREPGYTARTEKKSERHGLGRENQWTKNTAIQEGEPDQARSSAMTF